MVYQNEEGRWVTDLAYYTSFKEQAFNHSDISGDFISGCKSDYNIEAFKSILQSKSNGYFTSYDFLKYVLRLVS